MGKTVAVLVFANGDFEGAYPVEDARHALTFMSGASAGAGLFGGDGYFATMYPIDAWSVGSEKYATDDYREAVPDLAERMLAERAGNHALRTQKYSGRDVPSDAISEGKEK